MDVVELDCPSCGTLLEVDRGFAGGVCRCFHCGALLTVPSRAGVRAERLTRPERPDRPGRPETPKAVDQTESYETPRRPESPYDAKADTGADDEYGGPADEHFHEEGPVTYTTASGRTFRFDDEHVPTARQRRKVVRATTYGVVIGLTLLIVVGAALGIILLLSAIGGSTNTGNGGAPEIVEIDREFTYDPLANPLHIDQPNAMGLPLKAKSAVVLDLAAESQSWATDVAQMLASGAARVKPGQKYQVVVAHDNGADVIVVDGNTSAASQLRIVADRFAPAGAPDFLAAVKKALDGEPEQLVLITGRDLPHDAVTAVVDACAGRENLRLDVLTIDVEMLDLSDAARRSGGEAQILPRNRINTWREDAEPSPGD